MELFFYGFFFETKISIIKFVLFLVFVLFSDLTVQGQSGLISSGISYSNQKGSISSSVGQIDFLHTKSEKGSIRAGLQHPIEYNTVSNINNTLIPNISLYPNPTSDLVLVKIEVHKQDPFQFNLFDLNGQIIKNGLLFNNINSIFLSQLPSNTYILSLYLKNQFIQSFQIIKN